MYVNPGAVFESARHDPLGAAANREVSELLLRAIRCVERDEAVTIDLIKRVSSLLGPHEVADASPANAIVVGGLAPWQAKRVSGYIAERIAHAISLPDLAGVAKLSTSYFSAAFKVSFGMSPHAYIIHQRVALAKDRMLHSEAPLCEIALDCGLSDQAHLSRIFRKVTGTTPSAWRRSRVKPQLYISA